MKSLLVLFALGVAVSAIPYKFDHDIKMNVYDTFKSLYAAAPLSAYLDTIAKGQDFKFSESFFHFYPEEKIHDVLVVYKPKGENYLHGYYVRAEDVSKYSDEFFDAVRPIYEYLNSGEYYAFTPYAAKQAVPSYFNAPLKKIFYQYYSDVDTHREIPLVFIVPKDEVKQDDVNDLILIAEYDVSKDGNHNIHEYFENSSKNVNRRDIYAVPTTYGFAGDYAYSPAYYNSYYRTYPYYHGYGYPDHLRGYYGYY